jgi:MtN3 and saliva related transmembrane protein
MSLESHHRIHEKIEDLPRFEAIHSKKSVKIIDRWVLGVGIVAPFSTLPQIYQIVSAQSAQGVSVYTWVLFTIFSMFWLVYGIVHEELPIIVTNTLWVLGEAALVAVVLVYR